MEQPAASESNVVEAPSIAGYAVGIRPAREGGFRVAKEEAKCGRRDVPLVHAYGFGGTGYAFAYGVAEKVLDWVREGEREQSVWFREDDGNKEGKVRHEEEGGRSSKL